MAKVADQPTREAVEMLKLLHESEEINEKSNTMGQGVQQALHWNMIPLIRLWAGFAEGYACSLKSVKGNRALAAWIRKVLPYQESKENCGKRTVSPPAQYWVYVWAAITNRTYDFQDANARGKAADHVQNYLRPAKVALKLKEVNGEGVWVALAATHSPAAKIRREIVMDALRALVAKHPEIRQFFDSVHDHYNRGQARDGYPAQRLVLEFEDREQPSPATWLALVQLEDGPNEAPGQDEMSEEDSETSEDDLEMYDA
ncbi:hypothetical protein LTR85_011091 [Meristemomyces frigidus]|nr:hypothetical protein LTR85_011091 [Meristemomyces frigidus]